jgi:hypothetical protein
MGGEPVGQRLEKPSGPADPVGKGAAVELDAAAGVDRRLPVQGLMIAILGDEDLGQDARARPTALDRQRRHRRLVDALAGPAGEARPDVADYPKLRRLVPEDFADVLADRMQGAAAGGTGAAGGFVPQHLARQMFRQRLAAGLRRRIGGWLGCRVGCRVAVRFERRQLLLDCLQLQRQLVGVALLRRAAELLPTQHR